MTRLKSALWIAIGAFVAMSAGVTAGSLLAAQAQFSSIFTRVYQEATPGLVAPVLITRVQPVYSETAMRAKIQGDVTLDVTIGADGQTRDAMVTTSVEPSLDESAVSAVSRWIFKPGRLKDVPVAVRKTITLSFGLH